MMAMSNTMPDPREPGDVEALLPWYAAGTLNARDARRVADALDRDPALARRSMELMAEQVMPRVNAAIEKSKAAKAA